MQNEGVGKLHRQAILDIETIYKICACDLLRRSVFSSPLFVYLKSKLKKKFYVSYKIFKFIILSICRKTIFEKKFKARSEENLRLTKNKKGFLKFFQQVHCQQDGSMLSDVLHWIVLVTLRK